MLEKVVLDEAFYYTTRYGTPVAYCRALDIAAALTGPLDGRAVLDFGYGTIGHLRMLADGGARVVGVEVDPVLATLYSEVGDQGPVGVRGGSLRLVHGRFPADPAVTRKVGTGFDLVISKNVLKRGYIHPEREVDERMLIKLGVSDAVFCQTVFDILEPGGVFMIYNLSPKPSPPDQPYKPWADGRSPFKAEQLQAVGFDIEAFDVDDTAAARSLARALEWGATGMDIDNDLFGHYTLARKPVAGVAP